MPTQTIWVEPELFLEHAGVKVFHTYKHDDIDQETNAYLFTLNRDCGVTAPCYQGTPCTHVFDVRELTTWQLPAPPPYCTGENDRLENHAAWERYWSLETTAKREAIEQAIAKGELS